MSLWTFSKKFLPARKSCQVKESVVKIKNVA